MYRLLTKDIRIQVAKNFIEMFSSNTSMHYVFAAKSLPYNNDDTIIEPEDSVTNGFYKIYEDMIFAKKIGVDDVSFMIRNIPWVEGRSYDMYDDTDPDLYEKDFYVIVEEYGDIYSVFKCLYNGRKKNLDGTYTIPTVFAKPLSSETSGEDEYYQTADGYVWKLMGTMERTLYDKFATDDYVPAPSNTEFVSTNAVNGAINFIEIVDSGSNYNAYAYGTIKQTNVAGDPKIFSLQTDNTIDITTFTVESISGTFIEYNSEIDKTPKKVFFKFANNEIWSVSGSVYSLISQSTIRVMIDSGENFKSGITEIYQTSNNSATGPVTARGSIIDFRRDLSPALSANTDFYKNSSFYIRSGPGAGQLRSISEYIVSGNERRVLIDEAFDVEPNTTSRFEIGPRIFITGNGTGSEGTGSATAVATVNPSGNTIFNIEMIDPGVNYTYANAIVQSNTGFVDINTGLPISANSASVRPIISPPGGHGFDLISELDAEAVGLSATISGSEMGKLPVQNDYRTIGVIKDTLFANVEITIADSALIFSDGDIVIQPSTGVTAEVSAREGNTLRLRNINGILETGSIIQSTSNETIQSLINSIDRSFNIVDQRTKFTVEITNLGPQGTGFLEDEYVIQNDTSGTGYVYSTANNRIDLVGVRGVWNSSDDGSGYVAEMTGTESGAVAKITGIIEGGIDDGLAKNSGKILYLENIEPISRAEDQTERLKLVLKF